MDLYELLPHEDRIAAAKYLEQSGILAQLCSQTNHQENDEETEHLNEVVEQVEGMTVDQNCCKRLSMYNDKPADKMLNR